MFCTDTGDVILSNNVRTARGVLNIDVLKQFVKTPNVLVKSPVSQLPTRPTTVAYRPRLSYVGLIHYDITI